MKNHYFRNRNDPAAPTEVTERFQVFRGLPESARLSR